MKTRTPLFLRHKALTLCLTAYTALLGGPILSTAQAGATSPESQASLLAPSDPQGEAPTPETMRGLAKEIANGDSAALTRLETLKNELYRDIDYQKEPARVRSNLVLMNAAFHQLGTDAGAGNLNSFRALKQALGASSLRAHAPTGLGIAASAGHLASLEILLNHHRYAIPLSSAVIALGEPASQNNERAVAFLAEILDDGMMRALSHAASRGLVGAANAGNKRANAALDAYAARGSTKSMP